MGKSTISMAIVNSYVTNYQRVGYIESSALYNFILHQGMVVDQSFSKDQPRFEIRSDEGENEGNVNFTHHSYGISPRKMVDLTNLTGSFTWSGKHRELWNMSIYGWFTQ